METQENKLYLTKNQSKRVLVILTVALVLLTMGYFTGKGLYHILH